MYLGTDFNPAAPKITDNNGRTSVRWSERPDENGASSNGWTWVAALLVAALFIVSGYLDREAENHSASSSGSAANYASNTTTPGTSVGPIREKGY